MTPHPAIALAVLMSATGAMSSAAGPATPASPAGSPDGRSDVRPDPRTAGPEVPVDPAGWSLEPLVREVGRETGLYRLRSHTLVRVKAPASGPGKPPVYRIGLRPEPPAGAAPLPPGTPEHIEFSVPSTLPRGDTVAGVVPVILYEPVSRFRVRLYGERDELLAQAVLTPSLPMAVVPAGRRMMLLVSDAPAVLSDSLTLAGLRTGADWVTASVPPGDVPESLSGLRQADAIVVDAQTWQRSLRRQRLLFQWASRRNDPAVEAAVGSPLILLEPSGVPAPMEGRFWHRNPKAAADATLWSPLGRPFEGAGTPLGIDASGWSVPLPTRGERPVPDLRLRLSILVGAGAMTAAVALAALFFRGPGAGLAAVSVLATGAAGTLVWLMPQTPSARLDLWEIVEHSPPRQPAGSPLVQESLAPLPFVRMLGVTAAPLRGGEVDFSTVRGEPVEPVSPHPNFPGRGAMRIETRSDGDNVVTLDLAGRDESRDVRDAVGRTWRSHRRTLPLPAVMMRGSGVEAVPVAVTQADARTLVVELGRTAPWKLQDAVILDVRRTSEGAGRGLSALLTAGGLTPLERDEAARPTHRAIPLGDIGPGEKRMFRLVVGGPAPGAAGTPVASLPMKSLPALFDPAAGDDERTRLRKGVLAAAFKPEGLLVLRGPVLIGWADFAEAPITAPPTRVRTVTAGRLVVINLPSTAGLP